jgi:hypothetical protein
MHRELIGLHTKKVQVLEDPTESHRPAFGISRSPNGVEKESNSCRPPRQVVRNRMRAEIEKDPRQKHRRNSNRCEACRPGDPQGEARGLSSPTCKTLPVAIERRAKIFRFVVAAARKDSP